MILPVFSCIIGFVIGLLFTQRCGNYFVMMFDDYSATLPLIIVVVFETFSVSWLYGADRWDLFSDWLLEILNLMLFLVWMFVIKNMEFFLSLKIPWRHWGHAGLASSCHLQVPVEIHLPASYDGAACSHNCSHDHHTTSLQGMERSQGMENYIKEKNAPLNVLTLKT